MSDIDMSDKELARWVLKIIESARRSGRDSERELCARIAEGMPGSNGPAIAVYIRSGKWSK
jgi:hypothetical protein